MAAATRPKVDSISPGDLVDLALQGRIRMPTFQRSYRWDQDDVTRLFDSVLRGYPIGIVLFWQRPATAASVLIGHLRIEADAVGDAFWVVDGQQRITSLVGALTATEETVDPRFRIYFDVAQRTFVSLPRRHQPGEDRFPMSLVLDPAGVNAWIRARAHLSSEQIALVDQVVAAVRDYRIPMYVVTGHHEDALRDIFERTNTFGKPLKSTEVFNALHAMSGKGKPGDLRMLRDSVRTFGFGELPEQILVQSLLAIRGVEADRDLRDEFVDDDDRRKTFARTESALGHVVDYLRDEAGIPHVRLVPREWCIPVLAGYVATFGPPQGRAAELIRRWIWRSAVLRGFHADTVELRSATAAVHTDPLASAQRLLGLLPRMDRWSPDLSKVGLDRVEGRVNVLGLLSRSPRRLFADPAKSGEPIDVMRLLDDGGPLIPIIQDSSPSGHELANRLIHPPSEEPIVDLLMRQEFDDRVLAGHCLDAASMALLRGGRLDGFLRRRAEEVRSVIADHVQSRALFGFPDGPDVTALLGEGEEFD
ncbi:DUF262 domain-containing protein [Nonomuraea sp. MCN248]|uniref:DUF262 domain-containing protein n=1 Tax=Nonomuraea corallina TaxID=2989783 RepID=A0ABT4SHB6_9ACTN|nr:DUF262 domain-containing protein [Nonomuraea corallina]MDA0636612.1 DUF262 domain-containing protein [Nonomuraea corallina]